MNVTCKTTLTTTVLLAMLMSTFSYAGGRHHGSEAWAKVTRVEPITRMVEHTTPEKNCWNERVEYETRGRDGSYTSTILGGIIGGAVGNAVGHKKKNKQIGTAVGAILGASIGNDIGSRERSDRRRFLQSRVERGCETTEHVSYEEEIVGYKVWYRYNGEKYRTRMDYKPGKRIKVRVTVSPI